MTVTAVCGKLGMTRQNYYGARHRRQRREIDEELVLRWVRQERGLHPRMGVRKLHHMLQKRLGAAGVKLGRDRLFELLGREELLVPPRVSERPRTTRSGHSLPVFTNRIKGLEVKRPNEVWVGDLTYLRTREGFLYLALLTDKSSRKIVGWHCGDTLEAEGCLKALEMAVRELPLGVPGPIHHSDRGCQYCSHEYVKRALERGLSISMTEVDHCAENAQAERMNGILKTEYGLGMEFGSKAEARRAVEEAVYLYNRLRPHTALKYRVPAEVHSLAA